MEANHRRQVDGSPRNGPLNLPARPKPCHFISFRCVSFRLVCAGFKNTAPVSSHKARNLLFYSTAVWARLGTLLVTPVESGESRGGRRLERAVRGTQRTPRRKQNCAASRETGAVFSSDSCRCGGSRGQSLRQETRPTTYPRFFEQLLTAHRGHRLRTHLNFQLRYRYEIEELVKHKLLRWHCR